MHPARRIEAIRSAAEGEISPAEIRAAAQVVETSTPRGILYSTLACEKYRSAMFEAAADRPSAEEEAWLTLAAAGPMKARLALAWFAAELVDRDQLIDVVVRNRRKGASRKVCRGLAAAAGDEDAWGAWLLLSWLWPKRLEAMVRANPRLAGAYRAARAAQGQRRSRRRSRRGAGRGTEGQINPQIAAQFQALGLA